MNKNFLELIKTRRSIRSFTGETLDDGIIRELLEAGFVAPSAVNRQPVEFIVIRDEEIIREINSFQPYTKMLGDSKLGIVVCGDLEREPSMGFLIEGASAAIQNILLAGHGLGLGTVWCGIYGSSSYEENFRDLLGLPENIVPVGLVVVGKTKEEGKLVDRYREDRIHLDRWKGR